LRDTQWVRLADGSAGHVAIAGGGQSGKSQLLRTLILGLALTHTPQEAQVYCLDFGGGSLGALRDLPHVGGVAGRLEGLQVRRTVAEVMEVLNNREARFAQHGIESMVAYRRLRAAGRFSDDPYGDVFLVVDGWNTIRDTFDDLEGTITEIATRGLAYGVHVVVSTLRWRDFRPAIADQFGTKLELKLGDPSDSLCRNRKIAPNVPTRPGFGVTPEGLFTLALRPEVDAVGNAEELVKQIAQHWTGAPSPRVRMLPSVYPFERMTTEGLAQWTLPVGLADDLTPATIDFMSDVHLVAFGESECGKSTLLRQLAKTITQRYTPDEAKILIIDPRRSLLGSVTTPHLIGNVTSLTQVGDYMNAIAVKMAERRPPADVTPQQMRERPWLEGRGEFFLIVDDYDIVNSSGTAMAALVPYLFEARDVGLHLITVANASWSRGSYDPALSQIRSAGAPYLLMSADRSTSVPFGGGIRYERMTAGRGRLVTRRGMRLIQLADLPAA
jgi:S-DNA-T family DNA segregation ATPase FtsK/SpoIIIE